MKRYTLLFIFYYTVSFSQSTDKKAFENINKFIQYYFTVEKLQVDYAKLPDYFYINVEDYKRLNADQKWKFDQYLLMLFDSYQKELKKNNLQYTIVRHSDTDIDLMKRYKLLYPDKTNVYYIICNNMIFTHFILDEKDRIISFCPNVFMMTGDGRIEPFMLNKFYKE